MDTAYKVEFFGENGWEDLCETYSELCAWNIARREADFGSDVRVTVVHRQHSVKVTRNV